MYSPNDISRMIEDCSAYISNVAMDIDMCKDVYIGHLVSLISSMEELSHIVNTISIQLTENDN